MPDITQEDEIIQYINTLDAQQKLTIEIGKELLKDSFEIEKTIGFKNWHKLTLCDISTNLLHRVAP